MRMGRKRNKVVGPITVTDMGDKGKGVGRFGEMVVFIQGAVPGDVVDVQLTKKRKSFAEGYPSHYHSYSPDRTEAFCEHFGTCGGCKWQHLEYSKQLAYKKGQVVQSFRRIGKMDIDDAVCADVLPSENTKFYRNKLEFTFTANRWLAPEEIQSGEEYDRRGAGFNLAGYFDRVLNIENCYLQAPPSNQIRLFVRDFAIEKGYEFYSNRHKYGFVRNMMVRNTTLGEVMVVIQFFEFHKSQIEELMAAVQQRFPEITSLNYVVNQKGNDTIYDQEVVCYYGKPYITEELDGLKFRIGPKSFFQTNSNQALQLYKTARDFAELGGDEVMYDLYSGTGTISLFMARYCKTVIGLESVPEAVADAKENARLNGIENVTFFTGDMKDLFSRPFLREQPKADVVICDPPRVGMHPRVVENLLKLGAEKLVYVSCNPATQSRDIALLSEKYELVKMQPVDMFPHTWHIENVALLKLKD